MNIQGKAAGTWWSGGPLGTAIYTIGALVMMVLPPACVALSRFRALRANEPERTAVWLVSRRRAGISMIIALSAWWSFSSGCIATNGIPKPLVGFPAWGLFLIPICFGSLVANVIAYCSDRMLLSKKWTEIDILRLSIWSTLSGTAPRVLLAIAFDAAYGGSAFAIVWASFAGVLALIATLALKTAQGINPRPVKSGELYKRAFILAKQMGVPLKRVCVVPFGRGHLTNAFGGVNSIAVTDDYGHWLHGAELDYVIGHELAHLQQKHWRNKLFTLPSMFAVLVLATFAIPPLWLGWLIVLKFAAIMPPLLASYHLDRRLEYAADRIAVSCSGENVAIQALQRLYEHAGVPTRCSSFEALFSTHPRLDDRIRAISRLRGSLSSQVSHTASER